MVAFKLRAAFLGCALLVAAARVQTQPSVDHDCDAEDFEDPFAVEEDVYDYDTTPQTTFARPHYRIACEAIAKSISPASHVFFPGELPWGFSLLAIYPLLLVRVLLLNLDSLAGTNEFKQDMSHWANSSSEVSACSVRPGTPQDVGLIVSRPQ